MRCHKMKIKCEYVPIGQYRLPSALDASTPSPTTPDMPFRADLYSAGPSNQWAGVGTVGSAGDQPFVAQPSAATTTTAPLAYDQHAAAHYAPGAGDRRFSGSYAGAQPWISSSLPARSYSPMPEPPAFAPDSTGERPDAWMGSRVAFSVSHSTPSSPAVEPRGYASQPPLPDSTLSTWRQAQPTTTQWRENAAMPTLGGPGTAADSGAYPGRMDGSLSVQQYYAHAEWS